MRFKTLRNALIATGILGIAAAQVPVTHPQQNQTEFQDLRMERTHRFALDGRTISIRGNLDAARGEWNGNGTVIFANPQGKRQYLTPPKTTLGNVVIGESPADVVLSGALIADSVTVNSGAVFETNGYPVTVGNGGQALTIHGTLNAEGSIVMINGAV